MNTLLYTFIVKMFAESPSLLFIKIVMSLSENVSGGRKDAQIRQNDRYKNVENT